MTARIHRPAGRRLLAGLLAAGLLAGATPIVPATADASSTKVDKKYKGDGRKNR